MIKEKYFITIEDGSGDGLDLEETNVVIPFQYIKHTMNQR
jgi:hypothetical protein